MTGYWPALTIEKVLQAMKLKTILKLCLHSLLQAGKTLYSVTPSRLKAIFTPAVFALRIARIIRVDHWVITGDEINSKQKLVILYIGGEENKNYLTKIACDGHSTESYIGRAWLWNILQTVRQNTCNCNLVVAEVPSFFSIFYRSRKWFYIPCSILTEIDLSVDISSLIKNKSIRSDIRRLKKNQLSFELTNELCQFDDFYYNMYLPYAKQKHGNRAFIREYDSMRREMNNCDLLLINKGEECIAGMMLAYNKNAVSLSSVGIKDANADYIKDGAIGALFCFSIGYLKEKKHRRVDFGLSRAFLKDGGLRYKKKWDPKLVHNSSTVFMIKALARDVGVEGFFLNNPFIYIDGMKLNGAVFMDHDPPVSEDDLEKTYREYYMKGMSKLVVFRLRAGNSSVQELVPAGLSAKMAIHSAESLFQPVRMAPV